MPSFNLLSKASKMPKGVPSFSLPAGTSCPASKATIKQHGIDATCFYCYAKQGRYAMPSVQDPQAARMAFVRDSLAKDNGNSFVSAMVDALSKKAARRGMVRIHDSGDFFHPAYVNAWARIAKALPNVLFWAPTREYLRPVMMPSLRALAALPNVIIRPSAAKLDAPAPKVKGLAAGSTVCTALSEVPKGHKVCPATVQGNPHTCDENKCTSCWTDPNVPKVYMLHGRRKPPVKL